MERAAGPDGAIQFQISFQPFCNIFVFFWPREGDETFGCARSLIEVKGSPLSLSHISMWLQAFASLFQHQPRSIGIFSLTDERHIQYPVVRPVHLQSPE